ncbi:F390 synthetase-related protein [Undibacterium umbellatum]|uniref:Adenylate synthase n=1 Tax=Undibacterium umbellatum TaxID=2762300 RepID=A0ABR6Z9T7_9BURK|nr:F390 synthetase-related protein [Undibacterium umbellatum]MBC3908527.1 adenylate synthase [Undibacterium umbellatum]
MKLTDFCRLVFHFVRTRWLLRFSSRAAMRAWQGKKIAAFLKQQLPLTPFYKKYAGLTLQELPVIDKAISLEYFQQMNVANISLEQASAIALQSESSRNFSAELDGITVGLSSGTQGPRGVFLTSRKERAKWAGIMMARALPADLLFSLIFRSAPVKIAFFLRANSNLYTTLNSKRIHFKFYDLYKGVDVHLPELEAQSPTMLVAPAHILSGLAELKLKGVLTISPQRVISVAEVLEPDDKWRIEIAFGLPVHQLYQCTEGFLAYTCELGVLHLNEEFVHIEPEWLNQEKTRFVPVITDFTRLTQKVIRYRLNDVLRVRDTPCPCGRASLALAAIEGRCDDILWWQKRDDHELAAVYPDMLRHAITMASISLPDYRLEQHGNELRIAIDSGEVEMMNEMTVAITGLAGRLGLRAPTLKNMAYVPGEVSSKRRRIRCVSRPDIPDIRRVLEENTEVVHA